MGGFAIWLIHGLLQYVLLLNYQHGNNRRKTAMRNSEKTVTPSADKAPSLIGRIVGSVLAVGGAVVGFVGLLGVTVIAWVAGWAAITAVVILTGVFVLGLPAPQSPTTLVEQARADYAPLASADDGVSYAADQAVAGVLYARDGVDFGVNWTLKKIGF